MGGAVPSSRKLDDVSVCVPIATSRIRVPHIAVKHDVLAATADGSVGLPPKLILISRVRTMVRETENTGWMVVGIYSGNHHFAGILRPNRLPIRFGRDIVDVRVIRIIERGPYCQRLLGPALIIGVTVFKIFVEPAAERDACRPVCLNV